MKKLMLATAFALMSLPAFAADMDVQQPDPSQGVACSLSFRVHIQSVVLFSQGTGRGYVICKTTKDGRVTAKSPVHIRIQGIGPGLGVFDLKGVAGNIGISNPREIQGTYMVLQANGGFGGAVGANLGFEGQNNGLKFGGSVDAGTGFGAYINGTTWMISL